MTRALTATVDFPETAAATGIGTSSNRSLATSGDRPFTWAVGALFVALLPACSDAGGGTSGDATSTGGGGSGAGTTASTGGGGSGGGTTASTGGSATGGSATGGSETGGSSGQPYPAGPYGFAPGSVITNYAFTGYPAPDVSVATVETVHLGDFYNPTGQGTYPAGSAYGAGGTMPKVLIIQAAAVWSGPDNYEADEILPGALASYGPCLGALAVLMDGATPGKAATVAAAKSWADKYSATYPVVIDPASQLTPIFVADAFPANILVDTTTMTIIDVLAGTPGDTFFQSYVVPLCP